MPFVSSTTPIPPKKIVHWVQRYFLFHNKSHPAEIGPLEIDAFLSRLAQLAIREYAKETGLSVDLASFNEKESTTLK
jgi:hypothetical protein